MRGVCGRGSMGEFTGGACGVFLGTGGDVVGEVVAGL